MELNVYIFGAQPWDWESPAACASPKTAFFLPNPPPPPILTRQFLAPRLPLPPQIHWSCLLFTALDLDHVPGVAPSTREQVGICVIIDQVLVTLCISYLTLTLARANYMISVFMGVGYFNYQPENGARNPELFPSQWQSFYDSRGDFQCPEWACSLVI